MRSAMWTTKEIARRHPKASDKAFRLTPRDATRRLVVQRALRRTESTSCGSTSGTGTSSSGGADHRRGQSRGTCTELGIKTVAVFPYEDRLAEYRLKADESYEIGERGHPVRAYLDIEGIVRAAKEANADAIYPGYDFLSENAGLARRCREEGITFIGPAAEVLDLTGNKATAIAAAREAGLPVLRGAEPSDDAETLVAAAAEIGYPVFVKAVAGGGGRGMRRVDDAARLPPCARRTPRSATPASTWSRPSSSPGRSRCRSWRTPPAT
jgi:hypothetical protein